MFLSARRLAGTLACLVVPAALHAQFGSNLIVNGNAEAGAGSPDGVAIFLPPGWTTSGPFNVVRYDVGGDFLSASDPGSPTRGLNYFAGGPDNGASSAAQFIAFLPSMWASIDAHTSTYTFSGWLGGFAGQDDFAKFTLHILDAFNNVIDDVTIVGPNASDRGGASKMLFDEFVNNPVPVGARGALVELLMVREAGSYNDGYADDLSLVLTGTETTSATPEPGSIALVATGFAGLVGYARRRRA